MRLLGQQEKVTREEAKEQGKSWAAEEGRAGWASEEQEGWDSGQ